MRAEALVFGALCVVGAAMAGVVATNHAMLERRAVPEAQSVAMRSTADAKYQPQASQPVIAAHYERHRKVSQGAIAERQACPRCSIDD